MQWIEEHLFYILNIIKIKDKEMIKLLLKSISVFTILLAVLACAPSKISKSVNKASEPLNQSNEQGNTSTSYDQFIFKDYGNCSDPSTVWFRSVYSWNPVYIKSDNYGRNIYAFLSLQLFSNGEFWAVYSENILFYDRLIGVYYKNKFSRELRGTWSISSNLLKLEGLGYGQPSKYYNKATGKEIDSFSVYLNSSVTYSGSISDGINMALSVSNVGPNGISVNEFCKIK